MRHIKNLKESLKMNEKHFDKKYSYNTTLKSENFDNDGRFETFGKDLITVMNSESRKIWTMVDSDDGMYLIAGYHLVNRIYYVLTNEDWTRDDEEYLFEKY